MADAVFVRTKQINNLMINNFMNFTGTVSINL